jgi:hypothetical protein
MENVHFKKEKRDIQRFLFPELDYDTLTFLYLVLGNFRSNSNGLEREETHKPGILSFLNPEGSSLFKVPRN